MAEKATLLSSIPPVAKKSPEKPSAQTEIEESVKTMSSTAESGGARKTDVSELRELTQQSLSKLSAPEAYEPRSYGSRNESTSTQSQTSTPAASTDSTAASAVRPSEKTLATQTVATEVEPAPAEGISFLQVTTYASFVLTFILAGFAAVVLFRKATKIAEQRFVTSSKLLAGVLGFAALHGFFATFLYTNYLRNESGSAPLSLTVAVWVVIGTVCGAIVNFLLTPKDKPQTAAVVIDASSYALVFLCVMFSFAPAISTNAAIILSLLGGLLYIVPVARSLTGLRIATVRHPELSRTPEKILLYSILAIPAIVPLVAFLHACGAFGPDVTLLLVNFLVFDFILLVGFSMIVSADELVAEGAMEEPGETAKVATPPEPAAEAPAPATVPPSSKPKQPEPVVEFARSNPPRPAAGSTLKPKKLPPHKPSRAGKPEAPAKPRRDGQTKETGTSENPPARVKAPAKPKKRF